MGLDGGFCLLDADWLAASGGLTLQQVGVGVVSDGVDVGRRVCTAPPFIGCHHVGRVDRQPFVRVDCHTEEAGVGLQTEKLKMQTANKKMKKVQKLYNLSFFFQILCKDLEHFF